MSETKHTRAPWFAVDGLDQEGEQAILIDCEDGLNDDFVICIMQGEDAEANAKLIAAAPELLALLRDIVAFYHSANKPTDKETGAALMARCEQLHDQFYK